jgi:mono/diheme cytochrome c family protein
MSSRIGWLLSGFVLALVVLIVGGYGFLAAGGVPMAASSAPLPFEAKVAGIALRASLRSAKSTKNPLPATDANLAAGAVVYRDYCAQCHGVPDHPAPIAEAMFPKPPQLLSEDDSVTGEPEGEIYWIATNGIRLSGMPGFEKILSDTQRWQATALLKHADALNSSIRNVLVTTQ